jgi:hypothetical protein
MMKIICLPLLTMWLTCNIYSQTNGYRIYSIGNSHTADFEPSSGFRSIATAEGVNIKNGWHINCGSSLYSIWMNPERICVEPGPSGNFMTALSSEPWDIITIQPFVGSEGYKEKTAARNIISYALSYLNEDSVSFFLYCTWPMNTSDPLGGFDYASEWLKPYSSENDEAAISREFCRYLTDSVRIRFPMAEVGYIPVGEVLYYFHESAQKGLIPGFKSAGELYRDQWHLNNVGRYIAALTVYCISLKADPLAVNDFTGFEPKSSWPSDKNITPEQKVIFRKIISQVISSLHQY